MCLLIEENRQVAGLEIRRGIRESILAMILVASRYENQFLSLNYVVNTTVTQNFDSCKSK